jgi:hypothetical protein
MSEQFISQFYFDFCSLAGISDVEKSTEPIILFIYHQFIFYDIEDITHFYDQRYIMAFDSLVKALLTTKQYYLVYHAIIANQYAYSDDQLIRRLDFCIENDPHPIDDNFVNILYIKAIHINNLAVLKWLHRKYPLLSTLTLSHPSPHNGSYFNLTFEMLQYLCQINMDIKIDNVTIIYHFDSLINIQNYLQLFSEYPTYALILPASIKRFCEDCHDTVELYRVHDNNDDDALQIYRAIECLSTNL